MKYKFEKLIRNFGKNFFPIPKPQGLRGDYRTSFYKNLRVVYNCRKFNIVFYSTFVASDGSIKYWEKETRPNLPQKQLKRYVRAMAQHIINMYECSDNYQNNDFKYINPKRIRVENYEIK